MLYSLPQAVFFFLIEICTEGVPWGAHRREENTCTVRDGNKKKKKVVPKSDPWHNKSANQKDGKETIF